MQPFYVSDYLSGDGQKSSQLRPLPSPVEEENQPEIKPSRFAEITEKCKIDSKQLVNEAFEKSAQTQSSPGQSGDLDHTLSLHCETPQRRRSFRRRSPRVREFQAESDDEQQRFGSPVGRNLISLSASEALFDNQSNLLQNCNAKVYTEHEVESAHLPLPPKLLGKKRDALSTFFSGQEEHDNKRQKRAEEKAASKDKPSLSYRQMLEEQDKQFLKIVQAIQVVLSEEQIQQVVNSTLERWREIDEEEQAVERLSWAPSSKSSSADDSNLQPK